MRYHLLTFSLLLSSFAYAQFPGAMDPTFGNDGVVITGLSPVNNSDNFRTVLIQPDGKIVAMGTVYMYVGGNPTTNYSDIGLVRYEADGSLDSTFGDEGIMIQNLASVAWKTDFLYDAALQSDGKIIATGSVDSESTLQSMVVRFLSDGTVDSAFGLNGLYTIDFSEIQPDRAISVALQSDNKIVAGINSSSPSEDAVVRLLHTGFIDSTFGIAGFVSVENVLDVAIQDDDKVIVMGIYNSPQVPNAGFSVHRFEMGGEVDETFGNNGMKVIELESVFDGEQPIVYAEVVKLQQDGKILVGGSVERQPSDTDETRLVLCRLNSNGDIDSLFANDGIFTVDIGTTDRVSSLSIADNGKIYIIGTNNNGNFDVVCLHEDGSIDLGFGEDGILSLGIGNPWAFAYSSAIDDFGRLLIGGHAMNNAGRYNSTLVRVLTDLSIGVLEFKANTPNALVYPNPVGNMATLEFKLPVSEHIAIDLLDIQGRFVNNLLSQENLQEGIHRVPLDFSDTPNGIYIVSISSSEVSVRIRVVKK
jgi:uncharacterized delta-60 repeat protein